MRDGEEFFTVADMGKVYRLSPKLLRDWRAIGEGPVWERVGSHIHYPATGVEAWRVDNTTAGGKTPRERREER